MKIKSKIAMDVTLTLELNAEQAIWLHEVMQNPLHVEAQDLEDTKDREIRTSIFEATRGVREALYKLSPD